MTDGHDNFSAHNRERENYRTTYIVTLEAPQGKLAIRGLRWILKRSGRDYGLRCVDIREERNVLVQPAAPDTALRSDHVSRSDGAGTGS